MVTTSYTNLVASGTDIAKGIAYDGRTLHDYVSAYVNRNHTEQTQWGPVNIVTTLTNAFIRRFGNNVDNGNIDIDKE